MHGTLCTVSHAAPGTLAASADEEANIANVQWYARAEANVEADVMAVLGCPDVRDRFEDVPSGNFWAVEKLLPCKLVAVKHRSLPGHLVILSRFGSFLQHVP